MALCSTHRVDSIMPYWPLSTDETCHQGNEVTSQQNEQK